MQVKLLRLIESGTYRRVGGVETLRADFRLVAATHKPLKTMVDDGSFRQDLYYRINAFPIALPALRERAEDIPLLIDSLIARSSERVKVSIAPLAMPLLQAYTWPGNVRELRNVIDRARLFADDGVIRAEHLPLALQTVSAQVANWPTPSAAPTHANLKTYATTFKGTRQALAQQLGLSERTLYRRLKKVDSP
jgi:DNA-binding NtrC family response regulator